MKLVEALAFAADQLTLAQVPSPQADATWLLCHVLGTDRSDLLTRITFDQELTPEQLDAFEVALARREKREPLQHITGIAYFRNLELEVGRGVFTPRPETEFVAQLAIDALRASLRRNTMLFRLRMSDAGFTIVPGELTEKELEDLATKVKTEATKLDKDAITLPEAEKVRRQRDLAEMDRDFQRKRREFEEDLAQRKNQVVGELVERANRVIRQIAEKENYDIIFQEAVYAHKRIDITDQVLGSLDNAK